MSSFIDNLLERFPRITTNITEYQLKFVMECLAITIKENVPGDIVELGCHEGTTSLFIRRVLDHYKSDKEFYVYDSFEGLPKKSEHDQGTTSLQRYEGELKTEQEVLTGNFEKAGLKLPVITKGWFADIPDEKYPKKISFAFFDGDFYSSIIDSFAKTYDKLSPNAIVCVHDYNYVCLPGVRKACMDYLADRPEAVFGCRGVGYMVKE
ncbi:MAG: TylF/MycF/NovP-related O-methyltransferase [Candidatus Auribacterota bacterium]|jgi:O-methyltransferase|nr:TylF/MycF/NovP-related O-methyltransferase [Candidatus Auribacterota bacterium]